VTTHAQRDFMGAAMDMLVAHRAKVAYEEIRPNPTAGIASLAELDAALTAGIVADCSGACKLIAHVAGLRSPDGEPWEYGNTESFYAGLPRYRNPRSALTGAFVFFGEPDFLSTQHMACVRHPGPDPVLFSHGGTGAYAAHFVPLSVEARLHVGEPVFLSIAHL
jgi:hypothetical protein